MNECYISLELIGDPDKDWKKWNEKGKMLKIQIDKWKSTKSNEKLKDFHHTVKKKLDQQESKEEVNRCT